MGIEVGGLSILSLLGGYRGWWFVHSFTSCLVGIEVGGLSIPSLLGGYRGWWFVHSFTVRWV